MLNTRDAMRLWNYLALHWPASLDANVLDFVGTIVDSMIEKNMHSDYLDALMLMSGRTDDDLVILGADKGLELFVEGLVENNVQFLAQFCRQVGYA